MSASLGPMLDMLTQEVRTRLPSMIDPNGSAFCQEMLDDA
jgi:hypothetical protein